MDIAALLFIKISAFNTQVRGAIATDKFLSGTTVNTLISKVFDLRIELAQSAASKYDKEMLGEVLKKLHSDIAHSNRDIFSPNAVESENHERIISPKKASELLQKRV